MLIATKPPCADDVMIVDESTARCRCEWAIGTSAGAEQSARCVSPCLSSGMHTRGLHCSSGGEGLTCVLGGSGERRRKGSAMIFDDRSSGNAATSKHVQPRDQLVRYDRSHGVPARSCTLILSFQKLSINL